MKLFIVGIVSIEYFCYNIFMKLAKIVGIVMLLLLIILIFILLVKEYIFRINMTYNEMDRYLDENNGIVYHYQAIPILLIFIIFCFLLIVLLTIILLNTYKRKKNEKC
jgi:hypothetical protein